jgi:uncharacterized protein
MGRSLPWNAEAVDDGSLTLLAGLVMLVGLAGVVVPVLPGTALVLAAGLGWSFLVADGAERWVVAGLLTALFAVGTVLKYALPGRRLKGELPRRTLLLAAAGAVVGLVLLPPLGLLLGGVVGTWLGEKQRLGETRAANRSTVRVLQAVGLGILAELAAAVLMVSVWLTAVVV